jgi:formylglycine-generating enzyme required for sulfatase activity
MALETGRAKIVQVSSGLGVVRGVAASLPVLLAFLAAPATRRVTTEPVTGMTLVRVGAAAFLMGSPGTEPLREPQERQHRVRLTRPFELGQNEVTQDEWRKVMGTSPSAHLACGRCPVENVSFLEVEEFVRRLDALSPLDGFRLPTEAEWELACRAGTTTPFASGDTLGAGDANVAGRWPYPGAPPGPERGTTTTVGTFSPNAWGFFDMHGNVWEWTSDWHCPYPERPVTDPVGRCDSGLRVIRGGSWAFGADSARCALRYTHRPRDRGPSLGFRVARDPER